MDGKVSVADRIKYFCATQSKSFYAGMVFSVFGLLSLTVYIPLLLSVALTPIITFIFYALGSLIKNKKAFKSEDFWQGVIAAFLGNAWVTLFVFI